MAPFDWIRHTAPFVDPQGSEPARFVLRQVADDLFQLEAGFVYDPAGRNIAVDSKTLVETDLASIPLFMAWFVPVNGRHTPAALVHDRLVADSRLPGAPADARADADDVFLTAMARTDVPPLRRNLMHTAVTAATRLAGGGWQRPGMIAWASASLAGTALLCWSMWHHHWLLALTAAVAPLPGALLWGRRNWRQGLLAGYAVWLVAIPALASFVAYGVYYVCEAALRMSRLLTGVPPSEAPRPAPLR